MRRKISYKLLSLLLAASMLFFNVPTTALAEDSGWISASGYNNNTSNGVLVPQHAYSSNDVHAVFDSANDKVDYTFATSIPQDATITGVQVKVEANGFGKTLKLSLRSGNGNLSSGIRTSTDLSIFDDTYTFGASDDTWGVAWTPEMINTAFEVRVGCSSGFGWIGLDHIQIKVTYTLHAHYTVSFDLDGKGTSPDALVFANKHLNDTITIPAVTANAGWTFTGWNVTPSATVTGNATYVAQYTQNTYTVNFDLDGKGTSYDTLVFAGKHYGDTIVIPQVTANTGWTFTGWNITPSATVLGNATYVVQYTQNVTTFTVTYHGNGNTGGTAPLDATNYAPGGTVTVMGPGSLVKAGFTFGGWVTAYESYFEAGNTFGIYRDENLIAQWIPNHTVTYHGNGNTGGTAPVDSTSYEHTGLVTVMGPGTLTKDGFTFAGWKTAFDSYFYPEGTFNIYRDENLYAQWTTQNVYTVTFDLDEKGTSSDTLVFAGKHLNDTIAIPVVTANVGWTFTGWDIEPSTTVLGNATYVAQYIQKTAITLTANSENVTYDGTEHSVTGFTGLPAGLTINGVTASGKGTNAGVYDVTFTTGSVQILDGATDVTDHYMISYTDGKLTVEKADVTITADALGKVYGQSDPVLTAVVSGAVLEQTLDYTVTRTAGENVGGYPINVVLGTNSVNDNYDITVVGATFSIGKKAATITVDNKNKIYGESNPALSAVVTGTVGTDTLDYTLSRIAGENVGTYAITATPGQGANIPNVMMQLNTNTNYDITVIDGVFTINKRPATITIADKNKIYGEGDPALSAVVAGTVGTETLEYSLSRTAGENAGTYAITASLGSGGRVNNKAITLSVNENYDITVINATLTIAPKAASVNIADGSKVYGSADPTFSAAVSGLVGSDTLNYTLNRDAGENTGSYAIKATMGANPNYAVTVFNGTLNITAKAVTITVANKAKTQGNADPALSATVAGLVGSDTIQYTLSRVAGAAVGTYDITASYTPNANYAVTVINGVLTINAAPVNPTATPDNATPTPTTTTIVNPEVPAGGPPAGASWALLNLLLAIGTALASIGLLIGYLKKQQQQNGTESDQKRKGFMRIFSLVPGIGAIVTFLLTENMRNPMVIADMWTLLMVGIAAVQGVVLYLAHKNSADVDRVRTRNA